MRRGLSGDSFGVSAVTSAVKLDHSTFFGGLGDLAKFTPISLIGRVHLGGSVRLVGGSSVDVSRVTFTINFGSSNCFDGYFHGGCSRAPERCVGR